MPGANFFFGTANIHIALIVIPGGDPVPPPELARNTPVLNVTHPGEVHVFVLLRYKLNAAIFNRRNGFVSQRLGFDVPLIGQVRLNDHPGAIATRHFEFVVIHFVEQAQGIKVGDYLFAGIKAIHALVGVRCIAVELGIVVEQVDHGQVVALTHLVIIEIVGRRDFYTASAELPVDVIVADNGNLTVCQRQQNGFADEVLVTLIFRVYRYRGVAEHGFRAGSGNGEMAATIGQRVFEMPEVAVFLFRDYFQIRNGGVQFRIPVDQSFAPVNQAVFVETDEHFLNGMVKAIVHGETLAAPVR